jgi:hypothetical protein
MSERCGPRHGGVHAFHAYDDEADAAHVAARFFAEGIVRGDTCVYFGDELTFARIRQELMTREPDSASARIRHIHPRSIFELRGHSPIGSLLELRDHLVTTAFTEGRHVRMVIAPASGSPDREVEDRTEAFESMFTGRTVAPGDLLNALCLYDRRRYSDLAVDIARAAHAHLTDRGVIRPNRAFMPPHVRTLLPGPAGRVA